MEQKKEKVLKQLQTMQEGAQKMVDAGWEYYTLHACCAVEFAKNVQALLTEKEGKLPVKELTSEDKQEIKNAHEIFCRCITMKQDEKDRMFNSGIFNDIAIGYGKLALESMGLTGASLAAFERDMRKVLDLYDAEDARRVYLRNDM